MKKYFLLLLLTTCMAVQAQDIEPNLKWGKPTDEELKMTEYAADKDADAVVLYRKTDVYYLFINGDFRVFYNIKARYKVLKPEGKRVADQEFYYRLGDQRAKEIVSGLKATAYNLENGKVVKTKMDRKMVNEEQIDKHHKMMKFSVPQVSVGTVLEFEYCIESDYYGDIRDWHAQEDVPVLYTTYILSIPDWFSFNIEETGMNRLESNETPESMSLQLGNDVEHLAVTVHTFTGRNLPAVKGDDYVWYAYDYSNKVTAELRGIYVPGAVHKNYSTEWEDIDQQLMADDDFGGRLKSSSPLKAEIQAAGIPGIADKKERIAAVWNLLKSKVRWNNGYALWGKSASKILKEGTGTNADINFLLINMLHDAGIESTPIVMRLRSSGKLPLTHASIKYLNTFVVGIHMTDSTMSYIDGSSVDGYLDVLPANLLVDRARAVQKDAPGYWVNLQQQARGRIVTTIRGNLRADGLLEGQMNSQRSEEAAASLRRSWRQAKDSVEQIQKLQERNGITILSYRADGRQDFSPLVKEEMTFTKQVDATDDIIYLNPLILVPEKESPFTADTRTLPIEFPYKQVEVQNVIITLPEGYMVEETPKPLLIRLDGATARIVCSVQEGHINVQYQMTINKTFFGAENYQDLKMFFDKVVESNKVILTVKKAQ